MPFLKSVSLPSPVSEALAEPVSPVMRWFDGADGVRLAATIHGPDRGTPVLLLGGMGQTRHAWDRVARRIAETGRRAITLDFRGHGDSDRAPDGDYSYPRQCADIAAVTSAVGRPVVLVGASFGGKIGLAAGALNGPDCLAALVSVDAVPRTNPGALKAIQPTLAAGQDGYATLEEAAADIACTRGQEAAPGAGEKLRRNMRLGKDGRWHWHWDQSYSDPRHKIGLGPGTEWLDSVVPQITVPVLLARCELSDIVTDEAVADLQARIPHMEIALVRGARHMLAGDDNEVFAEVLLEWLARTPV